MKLYEFEAAGLFKKFGVPVLEGQVVSSPGELAPASFPTVLKAQVLSGGRGKAGGIKFAANLEEARAKAQELYAARIGGFKVNKILAVAKEQILQEYYFSYAIDRSARKIVSIFSADGGVEIEETARLHPEKVSKLYLDPRTASTSVAAEIIRQKAVVDSNIDKKAFELLAKNLFELFIQVEAELAEINPLAMTAKGLLALDAKVTIDDNALFRHPEFNSLRSGETDQEHTEGERKAAAQDLAYVELDGEVAVIGCGAGLVMSTLDLVAAYGGRPACFLDLGGGASTEKMKAALDLIASNPKVKSVLINAFCGITRCDDLARGIVEYGSKTPLSIRLTGTKEEEGIAILQKSGISAFATMEETSEKAVALAK